MPWARCKRICCVNNTGRRKVVSIFRTAALKASSAPWCGGKVKSVRFACPLLKSPTMTYKVLIVDDAEINLILFEALLKRMGDCESVKFSSSVEGLACAKQDDFDLIIVDYKMRDLNGLEFI